MADNVPLWGQTGWANWRDQDGQPGLPFKHQIWQWNKIIGYMHLPCAPSIPLLIETAFPAAVKALADIATPDLKEAYKIAHGPRPGKPGKNSLLKSIKGMVDGDKAKDPLLSDGGKRSLFTFAELADKAAWYLFLFGVESDFVFNWTSAAWKMAGCIKQSHYWWEGTPSGPVWVGDPGGVANGTLWYGEGSEGTGHYDGSMLVPAGAQWYAYGSAQLGPYIANPQRKYRFAVTNLTTGEVVDQSETIDNTSNPNASAVTMTKIQPPRRHDQRVAISWFCDGEGSWDTWVGKGQGGMGYDIIY